MQLEEGKFIHIYNRGNNRQTIFHNPAQYGWMLKKIRLMARKSGVILLCYCLMPNHFHLLIYIPMGCDLNEFRIRFANMLSSYTRKLNSLLGNSGSLFQQHSKSKIILDETQLSTCFYYIHQNPIRAGLVKNLEDWPFSSYRDFAGLRNGSLCGIEFAKSVLDLPDCPIQFKNCSHAVLEGMYWHEPGQNSRR